MKLFTLQLFAPAYYIYLVSLNRKLIKYSSVTNFYFVGSYSFISVLRISMLVPFQLFILKTCDIILSCDGVT